jgi:hypothetical protein
MARRRTRDDEDEDDRDEEPVRKRGDDPLGKLRHKFVISGMNPFIFLPVALLFTAATGGLVYAAFVTPVWLLFGGLALLAGIVTFLMWGLTYMSIVDRNKVVAELRADGLRWWSGFGNPLEVRFADVTAVEVKQTDTPTRYDRRAKIRDLVLQTKKQLYRIGNADHMRTNDGDTLIALVTKACRKRNIPVEVRS